MQTTAKATRKELKQFITIYQSIIEFSLEKMGLEVIVKHNKADPDDMLDDINAKLIEVCENYLVDKKLSLDKFQLATIVMDLYSQAVSELKEPFKVIAKESKGLVSEYLEKNKSKREALERIKKENEDLDKELQQQETQVKTKKKKIIEVIEEDEPEEEVIIPKKKAKKKGQVKYRGNGTADLLADDSFRLPI